MVYHGAHLGVCKSEYHIRKNAFNEFEVCVKLYLGSSLSEHVYVDVNKQNFKTPEDAFDWIKTIVNVFLNTSRDVWICWGQDKQGKWIEAKWVLPDFQGAYREPEMKIKKGSVNSLLSLS